MTPTQIRHSDRNKTQENKSNQKHTNRQTNKHVNKKQADQKKNKHTLTHISCLSGKHKYSPVLFKVSWYICFLIDAT